MNLLDEADLGQGAHSEVSPRRPPSWIGPVISLLLFVALLAGFWAYRMRQATHSDVVPPLPVAAAQVPVTPLGQGAAPVALPPLADLDPFLRTALAGLTRAAAATAWFATDYLAEQFVAIVQGVAEGRSPMRQMLRLRPSAPFKAISRGGRTTIDPASYARYDAIGDAVVSLDPVTSARLYGTLKPRLEEAYATLGIPDSSLDAAVEGALVRLLATPVAEGPAEVRNNGGIYEFADARLEGLTPVQKLLLRTGPANAGRIRTRLREIALALGIPASRLPTT